MGGLVVDDQPVDIAGEQVAHRSEGDIEILVDQGGDLRTSGQVPDFIPEEHEKFHIRLEFLDLGMLGDGPDDKAGALRPDFLDLFLQDGADLFVLDFSGDPDMVGQGDENEIPAGQGDMAGEPGALGADGILADLHQDILAFGQQVLDIVTLAATYVVFALDRGRFIDGQGWFLPEHSFFDILLGDIDIIDIEKAGALEADIDKCGLHSRQDAHHPAAIDISLEAFFHRPLHMEFAEDVIFNKGQSYFIAP